MLWKILKYAKKKCSIKVSLLNKILKLIIENDLQNNSLFYILNLAVVLHCLKKENIGNIILYTL